MEAKKKEMIETIAEDFTKIKEEEKSFIAGYIVGKREEMGKREQKKEVAATA